MKRKRSEQEHDILRMSKAFQRRGNKTRSLIDVLIPLQRKMNRFMYDLQNKIASSEGINQVTE